MSNRFERGFVPPQPLERRTGGVDVVAATASKVETELLPLTGGLYNVYTRETATDPNWTDTEAYFLPCSGQALDRTTYSTLFNKIGTSWGVGDGATTFNLPNTFASGVENPYTVSVAPTTYLTVGAYGSGNFISHSHQIADGQYQTWTWFGADGDQRGDFNANPQTALSGLQTGNNQTRPVSTRMRQYIAYDDSPNALPLGTVVAHMTPIQNIATVLADNPKLLVASGQAISPALYPDYIAVNGATLPNLQGRFICNGTPPINMPAGAYTQNFNSTYIAHSHRWTAGAMFINGPYSQTGRFRNGVPSLSGAWYAGGFSTNYTVGPGNENRPYNTSVTYLIKVLP